MPREQSKNKTSILLHAPLVRWVQRTVILLPPPVLKIVNEIICVTPVSEEQQAVSLDLIVYAVFYSICFHMDFSFRSTQTLFATQLRIGFQVLRRQASVLRAYRSLRYVRKLRRSASFLQ